jgi:hypothetical protein
VVFQRDHGRLELIPLGDSGYRVCDASVPDEHAAHVVAFIEKHPQDVEVVWLRGAVAAPGQFESMDCALDAIDDVITTGEVRDPLAGSRSGDGPV